jgi:hypothetical protein
MELALVVVVALLGVSVTVFAAVRMWRASRSGAAPELVYGYLGLMLAASIASLLVLRAL